MSLSNRIWQIDALRGLATIGMIAFHTFFVLDFYTVYDSQLYDGWLLILARFVQFTFLGLVGVCLSLSEYHVIKTVKRGATIFALGMLLTVVTYFLIPEQFIFFGILHLIGLSIIICAPFAHSRAFSFFAGVLILVIYSFGSPPEPMYSIDYFPLFPWLSVVFFGAVIGTIVKKRAIFLKSTQAPQFLITCMTKIGRYSLLIYLLHVPAIILFLVGLSVIPWQRVLVF